MGFLFSLTIEIEARIEFGSEVKNLHSFAFCLEQDSQLFQIEFSSSIGTVDNDLHQYEKDHVLLITLSQDELEDQVLYSLLKNFEAKAQLLALSYQLDFDFHFEIEPMVKQ